MKKVAFITGSTRGIGKATALKFANNGYTVVLNGTKETKESTNLIRKIKKISPQSSIFYFDVSNGKQVEDSCQKIIRKYKKIDVLVNNAGILRDRSFLKMSFEEWDCVIKTNLYGVFFVTKQILPLMVNNNFGRVINISSIMGVTGNFGQTNYATTKAGLIAFTKSLAKEVAKYNVTVNAIRPGLVETDIMGSISEEFRSKLLEKIPLGRMAKPEEIAELALFLSSNESSYITGAAIDANGGWL